ncbi:hypothetical protein [Limimaricola hongkongensis]|uniref:hypothetical protein n=1 Tax=Limimaricola hongkongensis TaxID=278132 RepID=UPI00037CC307|nr:hypothetical protein [Limimaricola hongkongensis]
MTANMITLIGLLLLVVVAAGLWLRAWRRSRRAAARRQHAPHPPRGDRDAAAMARSVQEGHAGTR